MRKFSLAVVIASIFASSVCQADVFLVSFTGVVGDSQYTADRAGVFGPASTDNTYAGLLVSGSITFDTTNAVVIQVSNSNGTLFEYAGGATFGVGPIAINASFTLNGVTVSPGLSFQSALAASDQPGLSSRINALTQDYIQNHYNNSIGFGISAAPGTIPVSLSAPINYATGNGFSGSIVYDYNNDGPATHIEATLLTFSISQIAPVPEPSTWAMMILGFAGIGYLAYRRREQRAYAA